MYLFQNKETKKAENKEKKKKKIECGSFNYSTTWDGMGLDFVKDLTF